MRGTGADCATADFLGVKFKIINLNKGKTPDYMHFDANISPPKKISKGPGADCATTSLFCQYISPEKNKVGEAQGLTARLRTFWEFSLK